MCYCHFSPDSYNVPWMCPLYTRAAFFTPLTTTIQLFNDIIVSDHFRCIFYPCTGFGWKCIFGIRCLVSEVCSLVVLLLYIRFWYFRQIPKRIHYTPWPVFLSVNRAGIFVLSMKKQKLSIFEKKKTWTVYNQLLFNANFHSSCQAKFGKRWQILFFECVTINS